MTHLGIWISRSLGALALGIATLASAGPPPVVGGPLLAEIASMPAGQWKRVNVNPYSAAWTPVDLRPLNGSSVSAPSKIILAFSGFGYDTKRGDIIFYGGGHANYSGNDVYRWRAQSLTWERAALPSQIAELYDSNAYAAIDGADAAPASAHTYDNNLYLPLADRFLTFGGALYNTGGAYMRPDETTPGVIRKTGPYFFDPSRADGDKVGGTTGSHVQRVAPFPWVVGGNMWQNRDLLRNRPGDQQPTKHLSGCTAYTEEGGFDVVYVGATGGSGTNLDLFRYVFRQTGDPTQDSVQKVGAFYSGPTSGQTACGYDAVRKLFVRTANDVVPFVFWSLVTPGPANRDNSVQSNASISGFVDWLVANGKKTNQCGLDFDPGDSSFAVWCGGPQVWRLRPPPTNVTVGWSIDPEPVGGPAPPQVIATGVLGKWKYVPGYDVFVAVEDPDAGNVWIYKPVGWSAPQPGDFVNFAPTATLTSPVPGTSVAVGTPVALAATADDDGSVSRVEFLVNGKSIGSDATSPYAATWTPQVAGTHALAARAIDNLGGEGLSSTVAITVLPPNALPTVSVTAPTNGTSVTIGVPLTVTANANDSDGNIVKVEFFAGSTKIGEDTIAAYSLTWTPTQTGSVALTARATDNQTGTTTSVPVTVTVVAPNAPPTASLTSPSSGSSFALGNVVPLAATAGDTDGTVAKVEFYANAQKVGEDATAPYAINWTPSAAGSYSLTARAIDNLGAIGTSTAVAVTITDGTLVTVLQQGTAGYGGTTDTQLSSYAPTLNFGSAPTLLNFAQKYASLFRFAVFASEGGPVPNNAAIVSATLEVYKESYNYIYRLHPLLKAWDEAQATWNLAKAGSPWAGAGATGVGTDYATAYDAEFSAPFDPGWMTFDVTNRIRLIGQGATNYGWRVVPVSGYNATRKFYSSEYTDVTLRPRMTVRYTLP